MAGAVKDLIRLEATVSRRRELQVSLSPVTLGVLMKTNGQAGDIQELLNGMEFEEKIDQAGSLPDQSSTDNAEFKCFPQLLKDSIPADKTKYSSTARKCKGVSEETTTIVHRLKEMAAKGELLFPAINVNDCVMK